MPTHGAPRIGRSDAMEDLGIGKTEVLGTINPKLTDLKPTESTNMWTGPAGELVEMTTPPPPWELEDGKYDGSDARRYVEVPKDWTLRWINPKLLDQQGWRYWQPVMASDPRVTMKVESMRSVTNNIRRGGETGDILAWMYTSWVDSRRRLQIEAANKLAQTAVDRQAGLKEEFARGQYGPYMSVSETRHPSHTMADGRSMER